MLNGPDTQPKATEVRGIGEAGTDRYNLLLPLIDLEGHTRVATTNDLKNGMVLDLDGQLWSVVWFQHHKPGKGGAIVRTKLKNVLSGKVVDKTFNADVKVDVATVDKRDMTFLYREGTDFVFMDKDTYDQMYVPAATVGGNADYMLENTNATVEPCCHVHK